MLSRAEVAEVLNTIGFRQVGNSSWFGMGQEEGRAFPVFVHLKPAYIQAEVHLNLISPCHMSALYERCNQINSGIVLGTQFDFSLSYKRAIRKMQSDKLRYCPRQVRPRAKR